MQVISVNPSSLAYLFGSELADSLPKRDWFRRTWTNEILALYTAIVTLDSSKSIEITVRTRKLLPARYLVVRLCDNRWCNIGLEQRILKALSNLEETRVIRLGGTLLPVDGLDCRHFIREIVEEELLAKKLLTKEITHRVLLGPRVTVKTNTLDIEGLSTEKCKTQTLLEQFAKTKPEIARLLLRELSKSLERPNSSFFE